MMEFSSKHQHREHAVTFASRFVGKFGDKISGILSCFDRGILKEYLPFHGEGKLSSWVDCHWALQNQPLVGASKPAEVWMFSKWSEAGFGNSRNRCESVF